MPTILALLAMLLAVIVGCSDDDKKNPTGPGGGGTPTSTAMTGILASSTLSAKMSITISSASLARDPHRARMTVVSASGTLNIVGGGTVSLTGSYDTELDTLYLAGGGYVVQGTFDESGSPPGMIGNWFGPGGEAGTFGCIIGGDATVTVYCGSFASTISSSSGTWNMLAFADTALVGVAQPGGDQNPVFFQGTLSREETSPGVKSIALGSVDENTGAVLDATGTLDLDTGAVGGDWSISIDSIVQDEGTWEGALCP